MEILIYISLGLFAGILGGLFGIGRGVIIVPVLLFILTYLGYESAFLIHICVATSLGTIFFTALASAFAHNKKGSVAWDFWRKLSIGIALGSYLGSVLSISIEASTLKVIIGISYFLIALQILLNTNFQAKNIEPSFKTVLYGTGTGAASSILGIGGGSFTVPYLNYAGLKMVNSIGTASACGVIISFFASLGFFLAGLGEDDLLEQSIGFIYWPALLGISLGSLLSAQAGVHLAHKLSEKLLKALFGIFILSVSYYMLFI